MRASVALWISLWAVAAPTPTAAVPAPTANDLTSARIVPVVSAVSSRSPAAITFASSIRARTVLPMSLTPMPTPRAPPTDPIATPMPTATAPPKEPM